MKIETALNLLMGGQAGLALRVLRMGDELYRACFVVAAERAGIYNELKKGPADLERISKVIGGGVDLAALESWLQIGVALGELKLGPAGYALRGSLSKSLQKSKNDPYLAFLIEIVELHYRLIIETPELLARGEKFPFDNSYGELVARSSRISEPFIVEAMEKVIPSSGLFYLLEIGCGSGAYLRHACAMNPELRAVGLELQPEVASFAQKNIRDWGLEGRVDIRAADVREFDSEPEHDLVTLHQNIYYFPEMEREKLFARLFGFIKPGGRLLVTTACQGGGAAIQALDVWSVMTQGCGPLPDPKKLVKLIERVGFRNASAKRIIPGESFYAFIAQKP